MTKKKAVRKTSKRTTRKAGHKRPVPGWIILLSGVLSGLLLAVFIYVKGWVPEPIQNTQQPVPGVAQEAVKPVEDVSKSLTKQKPDYDFYSVLPEMEVVIPKEELAQQAARNSKEYTYILQVASYKTLADAEALAAGLNALSDPEKQSAMGTAAQAALRPQADARELVAAITQRLDAAP